MLIIYLFNYCGVSPDTHQTKVSNDGPECGPMRVKGFHAFFSPLERREERDDCDGLSEQCPHRSGM